MGCDERRDKRRRRETNCPGSNAKEDKQQEEKVREVSGQERNIVKEYQGVSLKEKSWGGNTVIAQGCGQTLGLGLGQSKDIVVVFY